MLEPHDALQRVGTHTDVLGECPLWDDVTQCLYWVDIRRPAIRRWHFATGAFASWPMPELVGAIALVDDGRLLVALPSQIVLFDPSTGDLGPLVSSPSMPEGHRFNDGRCDPAGRFFAGAMFEPRTQERAAMWCLEQIGRAHV